MNGLIDIQLVVTQILGFALFVWIMSRMVWKPLLAHLDARRDKIAGEFAEAEKRQGDADALRVRYEGELRTIEARARERLQAAIAEGQTVAAEIKAQAQREAADRVARAEDDIAREREKQKEILKEQVIALSMRTAEKILRQKLDDPAQRKLANEFIDEVGALR
jgi:F-type H+-transporting ATPase subunit b